MIFDFCRQNKEFRELNDNQIIDNFANNIKTIITIVRQSLKNKQNKAELSQNETFEKSVDGKVKEIQGKFAEFDTKFNDLNNKINEKMYDFYKDLNSSHFSLIVNNVSILGIFVAIVFAGYSTINLFENVCIDFSENFLISIFSIMLLSTLTYNLLIVLFYFIHKINRINRIIKKKDNVSIGESIPEFKETYKPFLIIDYILIAITILLGYFSYKTL